MHIEAYPKSATIFVLRIHIHKDVTAGGQEESELFGIQPRATLIHGNTDTLCLAKPVSALF